ncbi:MAG: FtsK/SpoIIIE domain-containing protein [Anaerolineae bacterium]|nr:FtsK/SpoIIIE domain-containing protein [Anaerolineae bacterium]
MSATIDFNRPPRILEPLPSGEVKLPPPPSLTPPPWFSWYTTLLPVAGVLLMVGVYLLASGLASDHGPGKMQYLASAGMLAMSIMSALGGILGTQSQRRQHRREQEAKEQAYQQALQQYAQHLHQLRVRQQHIRTEKDPDPHILLIRAQNRDRRLWERRPTDEDFLSLRIGVGTLPSSVKVSAPRPEISDPRYQPVLNLESEYQQVPDVPLTVNLRAGPLGITGSLPLRNGLARALIASLVVHHVPDEAHLLAIYSPQRVPEWEWLKWLPHTHVLDGNVRFPHLACDAASAQELLHRLLDELSERKNRLSSRRADSAPPDWPWLVLLVEDDRLDLHHPALHLLLAEGRHLNATAIFLADHLSRLPQGCAYVAEVSSSASVMIQMVGVAAPPLFGTPDQVDPLWSESLARALAPLRVFSPESAVALPSSIRLLEVLGIRDIQQYDAQAAWTRRAPDRLLKAVLGVRKGGQPLVLDLSHTGHGPHGLIAGTTGSGKSELLQTLVISLALSHHPHDLGFILVDFKGGGAFSPLAPLPHVLGLVTNISGNLAERALVALEAEIKRREHLFNQFNVNDIARYQELYWQRQGQGMEPLPRVVIIVDEFAELVTDYPEFMDGLVRVARVGRSLGIHLILATQSPRGKVSQQIWANSRFRICLRVEDTAESQDMLRRPDAAYLPRMPGRGYLQVGDNEVFELFQVARVASTYRAAGDTDTLIGQPTERIVIREVTATGERRELYDSRKFLPQQKSGTARTDLEVVTQHLAAIARRMGLKKLSSPWPEPLPAHIPLPKLLKQEGLAGWDGEGWWFEPFPRLRPPHFCGQCGASLRPGARFCGRCGAPVTLRCPHCQGAVRIGARFCASCGKSLSPPDSPTPRAPDLPNRPWLRALLGLLDDPAHQRQEPWRLGLGDQDGHLLVIGAPASGKEMWLRTLVVSLARTHTPEEVHFYLVDFGGQALRVLEPLPHVVGVFTPMDEERIRRAWVRLEDELEARIELCHRAHVDRLSQLRQQRPGDVPPALVVVVTGFGDFRQQFPEEYSTLLRLVREGGNYDIHVVMVGDRPGEIPAAISSVVARRAVLRLGDPDEYSLILGQRPRMGKDDPMPPGRGWYGRPPLEFQTASPGYEEDEEAQAKELRQLATEMRRAWKGPLPEPVATMPELLPLDNLLARAGGRPAGSALAVPIGVESIRLRPTWIDLVEDGPDFVVTGTPQSGKTSLLMAWMLALATLYSPQEVQFILISGRRNSLQPLDGLPHILEFARSYRDFQQKGTMARIIREIHRRDALFAEDISAGNQLPRIVAVWDDYDDFSNALSGERDIQQGLDLLSRRGRDVHFHIILAGPLPNLGVGYSDPLPRQVRLWRSGFVLRPLEAGDQNPLGVRVRASDLTRMVAGRGFLARHGQEEMVQVAFAGDANTIARRATEIRDHWTQVGVPPAAWPEE